MIRLFGEEMDRSAATQLGLQGDWTITMASLTACSDDVLENPSFLGDDEDEIMRLSEAVNLIQSQLVQINLPEGWWLVRMTPYGQDKPDHYGMIHWIQPHNTSSEEVIHVKRVSHPSWDGVLILGPGEGLEIALESLGEGEDPNLFKQEQFLMTRGEFDSLPNFGGD